MIPFALLAVVIVALGVISCVPGAQHAYTSLPMVLLWGAVGVASLASILRRRLYRRCGVFLLHLALLLILAGAAVTHFCGSSELLHLRMGELGSVGDLSVRLSDFHVEYYAGTAAPRDFCATVVIDGTVHEVAMNRVADVDGYRFFMTSYDHDMQGCTLTVSHDPLGTGISYAGYVALIVMMAVCSVPRRYISRKRGVAALLLLAGISAHAAQSAPRTVPRHVAEHMGRLYVYHNGRIAPLSTLADDFTRRLTGTPTYRGLSAEQVLAGWLFYYESWKNEPCIRIKDKVTRTEAGWGTTVALADFFGSDGYRFGDNRHVEANEKFSIASSAAAGSLWRIFPYKSAGGPLQWLSPVDDTPVDMAVDDWHITRHSLNYLAQLVGSADWDEATKVIDKIAAYQHKQAGEYLPSAMSVRCEYLYTRLAPAPWAAVLMFAGGMVLLFCGGAWMRMALALSGAVWVALLVSLNWIASGHVPLSNGEETMQWLALCSLVIAIAVRRRSPSVIPLGMIVAGLALAVSVMGQRTPQVTQLMPVLNSPLLSVHVLAVMLAYALLALMAMSGILWLAGRRDMMRLSRGMLRPAVFMLAAGIFIGAVWANVAWGRYWGWDPKEVWALITMLVYTFPLHEGIFPAFRRDKAFAIYSVAAFACVIMTYFGVNFILGGLHSYS